MKKGNLIILLLLLITTLSYGQNDFKEIKTGTIRFTVNSKKMKSKNIIKIYKDKIEISIDESKLQTKMMAKQNLDGIVTTFNVKEVDNGDPKIAVYKGDGKFTIDYSKKKPKVKLEQKNPNTGDDVIIIYQ